MPYFLVNHAQKLVEGSFHRKIPNPKQGYVLITSALNSVGLFKEMQLGWKITQQIAEPEREERS